MSTTTSKRKKHPKITIDCDKSNPSKKPLYIDIKTCTPEFQRIYDEYKRIRNYNKVNPSILTLIQEYRTEKLNALTDGEIIKEEIGGEVKKIKEALTSSKQLGYANIDESKRDFKIKENRVSFLASLKKFEKQGKLSQLYSINEKGKRKRNYKKFNLNCLYQDGYYKTNPRERQNIRRRNTLSEKADELSFNNKIDLMTTSVEYEARKLQNEYKDEVKKFEKEYENWKHMQEFLHPEMKDNKYDDKVI
jgi:hypothetical protein